MILARESRSCCTALQCRLLTCKQLLSERLLIHSCCVCQRARMLTPLGKQGRSVACSAREINDSTWAKRSACLTKAIFLKSDCPDLWREEFLDAGHSGIHHRCSCCAKIGNDVAKSADEERLHLTIRVSQHSKSGFAGLRHGDLIPGRWPPSSGGAQCTSNRNPLHDGPT